MALYDNSTSNKYGSLSHTFTLAEEAEINKRVAGEDKRFKEAMNSHSKALELMESEVQDEKKRYHMAVVIMIVVGVLMAFTFLLSYAVSSTFAFHVGCVLVFVFVVSMEIAFIFDNKVSRHRVE
jgi:Flp pilus assembly protein TadB